MKKLFATLCALCVLAGSLSAQSGTGGAGLLNVKEYSKLFLNANNSLSRNYTRVASNEDLAKFRPLGGDLEIVDTPLEIALLSTCAGVVDVRPQLASEMLGNPKQADLKLGAAVFQEMQIVRFMGNTAALGRHEGVLKFITDRGNASRAEIEAFYRAGIKQFISDAVDAEFGKVGFRLANSDLHKALSHNAVLTCSSNSSYTLSYGGAYTNNETRIITANSLEALLSEMRNGKYKADFDETGINAVRAQAALIPAVVYADWKARGVANGVDGLDLIKRTLERFYLDPNQNTYNALVGIYARCGTLSVTDEFAKVVRVTYIKLLDGFNPVLSRKIVDTKDLIAATRIPTDKEYNVFSTPYATGR